LIGRVKRVRRWITLSASGLLPKSLSAMVGAATGATGAITASTSAVAAIWAASAGPRQRIASRYDTPDIASPFCNRIRTCGP